MDILFFSCVPPEYADLPGSKVSTSRLFTAACMPNGSRSSRESVGANEKEIQGHLGGRKSDNFLFPVGLISRGGFLFII